MQKDNATESKDGTSAGGGLGAKIVTQEDLSSLSIKITNLENRAGEVERDFKQFETKIERHESRMVFLAGSIILVFSLAGIGIFFDYLKTRGDDYKEIIAKFDSLHGTYYSKDEIDSRLELLKVCLLSNSPSNCL